MKKIIGKVVNYDVHTGRPANYGFITGIDESYYVHRKNIEDKDGIHVRDIVYFSYKDSSSGNKREATHVKKIDYRYFMETDLKDLNEHFLFLIKLYKNDYDLMKIVSGYLLVLPIKDIFKSNLFQHLLPKSKTSLIKIIEERMFKENVASDFIDELSDYILSDIKISDYDKKNIRSEIINLKNESNQSFHTQLDFIIQARDYALNSSEKLIQFMKDNPSYSLGPGFCILKEIIPDEIKMSNTEYWMYIYNDDEKIADINTGLSCVDLTEKVCYIIENKSDLIERIDDSIIPYLQIQELVNENKETVRNWLLQYIDQDIIIWELLLSDEEKITDICNNPASESSKDKFKKLYSCGSAWKQIPDEIIFKYFFDLIDLTNKIKILVQNPTYLTVPNIFSNENERVLFINYIAKYDLKNIHQYKDVITASPSLSNLAYNILIGEMDAYQINQELSRIAQKSLQEDLSKNLDMTPFLPGCPRKKRERELEYGDYIYHCDGVLWPGKEGDMNRVYCYRMRRNGGRYYDYTCDTGFAHIIPDCDRDYDEWSVLELMACTHANKIYRTNDKKIIARLSGMINWYNSLRKRLYCSVCKKPLTFRFEKGNSRSSVYPRVFADCDTYYGDDSKEHDHNVYFSYCYNCGAVIDSRKSKFKSPNCPNPNMFLCIQCGSPDWNICPNCGSRNLESIDKKVKKCLDCGHRICNKKGQQSAYGSSENFIPVVEDLS